jgi:hypothetical protein
LDVFLFHVFILQIFGSILQDEKRIIWFTNKHI